MKGTSVRCLAPVILLLAVVSDSAFNAEVEQMLLADMEKSVEMQPGDLDKKSFWFRFGTRLARLTSPIQ